MNRPGHHNVFGEIFHLVFLFSFFNKNNFETGSRRKAASQPVVRGGAHAAAHSALAEPAPPHQRAARWRVGPLGLAGPLVTAPALPFGRSLREHPKNKF